MKAIYLEMTFRRGRAMAAYLYLPRRQGDKSCRTAKADPGMIIDFNDKNEPIGIEITAPAVIGASDLNRVLDELKIPQIDPADLAPLKAA